MNFDDVRSVERPVPDETVRFEWGSDVIAEVLRRLCGRWYCPTCKATFHIHTRPPRTLAGRRYRAGADAATADA